MGRKFWIAGAVAAACALLGAPAMAQTSFSVQIGSPGYGYGYSQPGYGYAQPGYGYSQPGYVYTQPGYVQNGYTWGYPNPNQYRSTARRNVDRDRDGINDRYDRDLDNDGRPNSRDRDRDGDGVPNRYDRRPDNRYRY